MIPGLSIPGIGGVGDALGALGGGPTSTSSSAEASGDVSPNLVGKGGAGSRGFTNNVAFPGASLNADQAINPPALALKDWSTWLIVGGLVLVGFVVWRRYGAR